MKQIPDLNKKSLRLRGSKPSAHARVLTELARSRAELSEAEALEIVENEVRQARQAHRAP